MRRSSQSGFSLIEITVVLAIMTVILLLVYRLIDETLQMSMFNESHNDLAIMSQSAVNTLQSEVLQTRVAFEDNTLGREYRSALVIPAGVTVWADSLLPVFDATGEIRPDTAAQRFTGNSLLLARQLEPLRITYDHDGNAGTPPIEFLAERYRFEYVYLSRKGIVSFSRSGMSLDLAMSTSGEYADFFQISSMGATATARIAQSLIAAGLQRAWNPGQPVSQAFYLLSGATDGTFDAPINNATIALPATRTLLRGLLGGRISGKMNYSVAFGTFPIRTATRVFAQPITASPGFPAGFEVKVAGPARKRRVMTRLVLMSHYGGRTYESQQAFVVTAARF